MGRPGTESHQRPLNEICMEDVFKEVPSRRTPQAWLGEDLSLVRLQPEIWDASSSVPGIIQARRWSCPLGVLTLLTYEILTCMQALTLLSPQPGKTALTPVLRDCVISSDWQGACREVGVGTRLHEHQLCLLSTWPVFSPD